LSFEINKGNNGFYICSNSHAVCFSELFLKAKT
jgi:hypothetical protein